MKTTTTSKSTGKTECINRSRSGDGQQLDPYGHVMDDVEAYLAQLSSNYDALPLAAKQLLAVKAFRVYQGSQDFLRLGPFRSSFGG